jgi:hypothetical protein
MRLFYHSTYTDSSLTYLQRVVETQQRKRELAELLLSPGQHAESEHSLDRLRVSRDLVEEVLEQSLMDCSTFDHCSSKQALRLRKVFRHDRLYSFQARSWSKVSFKKKLGTIHHLNDARHACKADVDALCWTNTFFSPPPDLRFGR